MSAFFEARDFVLPYGLCARPQSIAFPQGVLTALIGPNGAGKTTLLRSALGEPLLRAGAIHLLGESTPSARLHPTEIARLVAYVGQEHVYPGELSVRHLLRLAHLSRAGLFGKLPDIDDATFARFELAPLAERSLGTLSTGERQRVFLARAFLQAPRLIVLDEPTNHLDPGAVALFWRTLLDARRAAGVETIVSTHDLALARRHCDWICALRSGEVIFNGTAMDFWKGDFLARLFGPDFEL